MIHVQIATRPRQQTRALRTILLGFLPSIPAHLSLPASRIERVSGDSREKITRRRPVLISAVTAMPGASGVSRPSIIMLARSSATRATSRNRACPGSSGPAAPLRATCPPCGAIIVQIQNVLTTQ